MIYCKIQDLDAWKDFQSVMDRFMPSVSIAKGKNYPESLMHFPDKGVTWILSVKICLLR